MITQEMAYHCPGTLDEALSLLDDDEQDVRVLAGGMSLVPTMTLGLASPEAVVSLKRLSELSRIAVTDAEVRVGATATHSQIADSGDVQRALGVLAECAALIGDVQVRNRGTIGGSLAHADPAANYPPLALALGASMVIRSSAGERVVHADDFFRGLMETAVGEGDILTEVRFPLCGPGTAAAYCEFVRVEGNFALVNAGALVNHAAGSGRVAVGGVGTVPSVVDLGPVLHNGAIEDAGLDTLVDESIGDVYADINGSADYKRALARTFARRAAHTALSRAAHNGEAR